MLDPLLCVFVQVQAQVPTMATKALERQRKLRILGTQVRYTSSQEKKSPLLAVA